MRGSIIFLILVAVFSSCQQEKPNILFIMVDDLGKEWISAYGSESVKTPSIDKLAEEGVLFQNVYTMPQCTPTRLTLLTGQYPFRHGWINHWDVPRWGGGIHYDYNKNPTLGKAVKSAGYKTAIAGKWQVNDFRVQPDALEKHGFDEYLMWTGYEAGNPPSAERYWNPYLYGKGGSKTYPGKFGPDLFTDFLIDFISDNKDSPWFVYFPMVLTHPPLVPTPDKKNLAENINEKHKPMVEYMDKLVGRLVNAIDSLGIGENTMIIFTTDNGTSRGITGVLNGRKVGGAKALTIEPGICNPFIVRYPKTGKGKISDALIDYTDMYPTFCELTGAEMQKGFVFDGQSFAGVLTGKDDDSPRKWMMSMGGQNRAKLTPAGVENEWVYRDRVLRTKKYKMYINTSGEPEKLVDLSSDFNEDTNLLNRLLTEEEMAAFEVLMGQVVNFPARDNDPVYDPLPHREWYREPTVESTVWKKK